MTVGVRRWRRAPYPAILAAPVPDLMIDFSTGWGIPVAHGGVGGQGSERVQITSPQDSGNGARLVRAPRYWDPNVDWRSGEPIFMPKQAGRLVGWPGPRAGGYWTGPMSSWSSTSETVAVYASQTGLTVTTVDGGVVGPEAIRCEVQAGDNGDGFAAVPYPVMTSGWMVDANGNETVAYLHAVVELLGSVADYRFWLGLRDDGAGVFVEAVVQRYDQPDQLRAGKIYRGVGPHGGHLYEVWALARLISTPVGPISARAYLLSSGSGSNPARTVIVHGCQMYFVPRFLLNGLSGFPPFFSHARGSAVVWTSEALDVAYSAVPYTVALTHRAAQFAVGGTLNYGEALVRNRLSEEAWYQFMQTTFRVTSPSVLISGFDSRIAFRTAADYRRAYTVNGQTVVDAGQFTSPPAPAFLSIGRGYGSAYGQFRRVLIWLRALTDTELLRAFRQLGEPVP